MSSTSHPERTFKIYRSPDIHNVKLASIQLVNPTIRKYVISSKTPINFLPGQWLDIHLPGLSKPGGFTITSAPALARTSSVPGHGKKDECYEIHLAIQKADDNPAAEFLWQDPFDITGIDFRVRVGGRFTWPPPGNPPVKALFVAGGVGINPLMSMLNHITGRPKGDRPTNVQVLYAFKVPPVEEEGLGGERVVNAAEILFLPELLEMEREWDGDLKLKTFVTGDLENVNAQLGFLASAEKRRMTEVDVRDTIGTESLPDTTGYVCGPPVMTDWLIQLMVSRGLDDNRVLCEKWW